MDEAGPSDEWLDGFEVTPESSPPSQCMQCTCQRAASQSATVDKHISSSMGCIHKSGLRLKYENEPCACHSPKEVLQMMPCIGKGLYISGRKGVTSSKMLKCQKITHILNMAQEVEDVSFPDRVSVRHAGLRDAEDEDLLECLPELVDHIHCIISSGGRIVVNCWAGVSRSASVCLAYKVRHEGLSLREAFDEVHEVRSVISPNLGFWKALIEWEEEVRGRSSVLLKPFICGMVPELDSYEDYARTRISLGWMRELVIMWNILLLLFCLQLIAVVWF
ncbi:dual specificity protein phosphatase 18-like isoform X1 [Babylonia areolata]|uniref:dual specificity protein phosphatase 18-like isoform X1 n=1 Tax=Babylonia areolata TaxID=304850 RepID=UPI003FD1D506